MTDSRSSSPMDLSEPEPDDLCQFSQNESGSMMPRDKDIHESDDDTWMLDDKTGEK